MSNYDSSNTGRQGRGYGDDSTPGEYGSSDRTRVPGGLSTGDDVYGSGGNDETYGGRRTGGDGTMRSGRMGENDTYGGRNETSSSGRMGRDDQDTYGSGNERTDSRRLGENDTFGDDSYGHRNKTTNSGRLGDNDTYGSGNDRTGGGRMGGSGDDSYGASNRMNTGSDMSSNTYGSTGPSADEEHIGTHRHSEYGGHHPRDQGEYGSGTVGGAGFGNKTRTDSDDLDNSDTRFGSHKDTSSYSGGTEYGSGATGGAGYGNKHSGHDEGKEGKKDSTMGKLMEKAGSMFKNEGMAEKGRAKREEKGAFEGEESGHGRGNDSY
ncbi:hypothetical protein BJ546DRAFT_1060085 [Cryomyces antarcticus]